MKDDTRHTKIKKKKRRDEEGLNICSELREGKNGLENI